MKFSKTVEDYNRGRARDCLAMTGEMSKSIARAANTLAHFAVDTTDIGNGRLSSVVIMIFTMDRGTYTEYPWERA